MSEERFSSQELNVRLWNIAEHFRGHLDPNVYRPFFLTLFFYKYISDLYKSKRSSIKNEFKKNPALIELMLNQESFVIPENCLFDDIRDRMNKDDIGKILNNALKNIETANERKLGGIFTIADFTNEWVFGDAKEKNYLLNDTIQCLADIDLSPTVINRDIVANTFSWLLEAFALLAGKKSAEFVTPHSISRLMTELLAPKDNESIYDPACGCGGLLAAAAKQTNEKKRGGNVFGQEINIEIVAIAKMNMIIHGLDDAKIAVGDSINHPQFLSESSPNHLECFDIVVSNPPFSVSNWWKRGPEYGRFDFGMPPDNKGDYAFILHMLASTKNTGRLAVIVSHGVLFRKGSELTIRKKIINENWLDAVIGLPSNLFPNTSIPAAILLFDKTREKNKGILFIDASNAFEQEKRKNILTSQNIGWILKIYKAYQDGKLDSIDISDKKYYSVALNNIIQQNEYNISISRYVESKETTEAIDVSILEQEIEELDNRLTTIKNNISRLMEDLEL